jgi:hypothetical protein
VTLRFRRLEKTEELVALPDRAHAQESRARIGQGGLSVVFDDDPRAGSGDAGAEKGFDQVDRPQ